MPDVPIVSPGLRASFADAIKAIPTGKKFQAGVAVTRVGLSVEAGYQPKSWLSVAGYAGRTWGAPGWQGGARISIVK